MHVFPAPPSSPPSSVNVVERLDKLLASVRALAAEWTKDYIWQRTPFTLDFAPPSEPAQAHPQPHPYPHLCGTLEYGDAIDDEWFAVAILLEASRRNPDCWVRVWDSDGEFLLIEAAHALPRWLSSPEVGGNRVWIRQGKLWIIPLAKSTSTNDGGGGGRRRKGELELDEALRLLQQCEQPESLARDRAVETEALLRTKGYPAKAHGQLHRARVVLPRKLAAVLRAKPDSVAAAVEAFYVRDPVSLVALRRPPAERRLPWADTVETTVVFTKVLFAQLKGQMWAPPAEAGFPMAPAGSSGGGITGKVDVGVKLTAGFEMLLAEENEVLLTSDARKKTVTEICALFDPDVLPQLQLPTDEECAAAAEGGDSEDWLHIDFTEFEKDLKAGGAATATAAAAAGGEDAAAVAYGDPEQGEKLKRMVERFEAFLNDDSAGPDGALFHDDDGHDDDDDDDDGGDDGSELDSGDDIDSDDLGVGEDKDVSFDEAEFERMMRQMMGLPPDDGVEGEEIEEIEEMQDQIEKELVEAGAIERPPAATAETGLVEETAKGDVHIDYALAKNMLESFKGQAGLSGPASNLLARLGVVLPRDEHEPGSDEVAEAAEVAAGGKEKVKAME